MALVAAVLGPGCGSSPAPGAAPSPSGKIVQVTPAAAGALISLHVGDTLRVVLGPPQGGGLLRWRVRGYPRGVLGPPASGPVAGRVEFLAQAPGRGSISLVGLSRCGPAPGPYVAGTQCPVADGGEPSPSQGNVPARLLVFEVRVTG